MRAPFRKVLSEIEKEEAHGGSGARKMILSGNDAVSPNFEAMTKGYLAAGASFEWHSHSGVDEFFLVTQGTGLIQFRDHSEIHYKADELIYIPADVEHRIENTGTEEGQFYFIRLKA